MDRTHVILQISKNSPQNSGGSLKNPTLPLVRMTARLNLSTEVQSICFETTLFVLHKKTTNKICHTKQRKDVSFFFSSLKCAIKITKTADQNQGL